MRVSCAAAFGLSIASALLSGCLEVESSGDAGADQPDVRRDADGDSPRVDPPWPSAGANTFLSAEPTYRGDPVPSHGWDAGGSEVADSGLAADAASEAAADAVGVDDGGEEDPEDPDAAARVIEEADIVRVEGDRLFALSLFRGLVVIDVSVPDRLAILGRHGIRGRPFEMYLRDGVVFAMLGDEFKHSYDQATGYWESRTTSRVVALDVSDAAGIREVNGLPRIVPLRPT